MGNIEQPGGDTQLAIDVASAMSELPPEGYLADSIAFLSKFSDQDTSIRYSAGVSRWRGVTEQARKVVRHCSALSFYEALAPDALLHRPTRTEPSPALPPPRWLMRRPVHLKDLWEHPRISNSPVRIAHIGLRSIGIGITSIHSLERATEGDASKSEALSSQIHHLRSAVERIVPAANSAPKRISHDRYSYGAW